MYVYLLNILLYTLPYACADPGIFVRGGPGQSDIKKALITFFFVFFFLVLSLKSNGQFRRNLSFLRFQRGSNIFQGGGGVQLLIPYRNPYNL